jgi:uncharacterized protein (TIGR02678 family)
MIEEVESLEEEWEFGAKTRIKEVVKESIHELLERFWVLRETDEELFYQIKDNEVEIKNYFRDNFRYRLISTHDLIKLEKIPVTPYTWMGEKQVGASDTFKKQQDYSFFFLLLAFLESQSLERQFTLQKICEYLEDSENGNLSWKDGTGYQNRLSLIRILKYAVKMNLLLVDDQEIEEFAGDGNHDVLFRRTPYCSYYIRSFSADILEWESLDDFIAFLHKENNDVVDGKHRYYRRLFLEPIVYHRELDEEEQQYVKKAHHHIENNIYRYTDFDYERYKNSSLLVKSEYGLGEKVFPTENMLTKIILLFGAYLYEDLLYQGLKKNGEIRMNHFEMTNIFAELKAIHGKKWTKKYRVAETEDITNEAIQGMSDWNFLTQSNNEEYCIKEGLFRTIGIS